MAKFATIVSITVFLLRSLLVGTVEDTLNRAEAHLMLQI
jgi:hypothetical protein